jgi:hypothetical protein
MAPSGKTISSVGMIAGCGGADGVADGVADRVAAGWFEGKIILSVSYSCPVSGSNMYVPPSTTSSSVTALVTLANRA